MDAMIRFIIALLGFSMATAADAQQMNWTRLAEDTIYYANEYLPDHVTLTPPGPGQIWDFRSLRAPYAISRRILVSGEKDVAQLFNGKQHQATLNIKGYASQITHEIENNPVCPTRKLTYTLKPAKKPFFHNILGGAYEYEGKMQAAFDWPRDFHCKWVPTVIPDSCRITYTIAEKTVVDAEGTLYMPTEVSAVYRQKVEEKRTIKVETKRGSYWKDVTSLIPGIQLITYSEHFRFVSSHSGLLLAEVEVNDDNVQRVEFKTHPLVTRIFTEEPSRPDIFAYPNPSYDVVRFQLSDLLFGKYNLKIFNILGVPVREINIQVDNSRKTVTLDLGDLQRGTYLFRLTDTFGRTIKTKRVVLIQA